MRSVFTILFIIGFGIICFAQSDLLNSGPMVGYSTMREVSLWVQTTERAKVKFLYWDKTNPANKHETFVRQTKEKDAFTAELIAGEVEPGKVYEYQLVINDVPVELNYRTEFQTQKLWQWRENPPDFKFAIGSCAYINQSEYDRPGKPYGGQYQIFTNIYKMDPDFFVWMGDDVYLREVDWNSRIGILKRYTHDRATKELQPMLGSMHNYATWDDHDYGPNNSDRSFWAKNFTREAFKLFWANPSYGVPGAEESIATYFEWADCAFFMTDDRTYRSPENRKSTDKIMLGDDQVEWLIDALTSSRAPFKFIVIGSTVLNPVAAGENYENYPNEKAKLMKLIADERIEGVVFLTGDIHRGELSKLERRGSYPLYEFTVSPLTAGVSTYEGPNPIRVDNTLVMERNFGFFEINGPRKNRNLKFTMYNSDGVEKWTYTINENELKYK